VASSELHTNVPITILMPDFSGGGAENAIVRLANHWHSVDRKVTIVVNKARGPVQLRLDKQVEVVDLGRSRPALTVFRLGKWLAERRPPLLVTVLLSPCVTGLLAARAWSPGTTVISLIRNHVSEELANRDWFSRIYLPPMLKYAFRHTDAIGCVASRVSQDIAEFAGLSVSKVHTTLNPVALPEPAQIAARPADMPNEKVLVAVGRLVPQKDYPTLVRALANLKSSPMLVVLGEGPLRQEIVQLAEALGVGDRVLLLGFKHNPADYVAHADVFVLTSLFEGFPNVVAEALALGKTVVATDAPGGTAEILQNGECGYLAPVGEADAIATAIQRALNEPIAEVKARARAAEFRVDAIAARYESIFATAMERAQP
jgi:glycosyltransferase involved in cell wall biosynthesis